MNTKIYKVQLQSSDAAFDFPGFACYTKGNFACIAYCDEKNKKRVKRWSLCNIHSIDCEY